MSVKEVVGSAIAVFLFVSPFLLFFGTWTFFHPVGFWETIASFIIVGIAALAEGIIAWAVGFLILDEVW